MVSNGAIRTPHSGSAATSATIVRTLLLGTGGFRKVRVARKGMGKSGGARVVYICRNERLPVFLIAVFPKNEKENLSMAERNALRKRADSIFEAYGK